MRTNKLYLFFRRLVAVAHWAAKEDQGTSESFPFTLLYSVHFLTACVKSPTTTLESLFPGTGLDPDAKAIVRATLDMIRKIQFKRSLVRPSTREGRKSKRPEAAF